MIIQAFQFKCITGLCVPWSLCFLLAFYQEQLEEPLFVIIKSVDIENAQPSFRQTTYVDKSLNLSTTPLIWESITLVVTYGALRLEI